MTVADQAPLSKGFPSQEYWSELPVTSPVDLPDPGIKPVSPALADGFFTTEPPGTLKAEDRSNLLLCNKGLPVPELAISVYCLTVPVSRELRSSH